MRDVVFPYRTPGSIAQTRLFCFAGAGGSAAEFYSWSRSLSPMIEVCAVELPGHGTRAGCSETILEFSDVITWAATALSPHLDVPFALYGHSLGALLAFEVASTLQQRMGAAPTRLFVAGHRAPHLSTTEHPVSHLPDRRFLAAVARLGGSPQELTTSPDLMQLVLPAMRADFRMSETYRYRGASLRRCPVTAYGGRDDAGVPRLSLDAWAAVTDESADVRMFRGGHYFQRDARAQLLADIAWILCRSSVAVS